MSHIGYLYLLIFIDVFHNTASKTENITVLINGRKQNVTFVSETTADNKNKQHVPVQHFNAIFQCRELCCVCTEAKMANISVKLLKITPTPSASISTHPVKSTASNTLKMILPNYTQTSTRAQTSGFMNWTLLTLLEKSCSAAQLWQKSVFFLFENIPCELSEFSLKRVKRKIKIKIFL